MNSSTLGLLPNLWRWSPNRKSHLCTLCYSKANVDRHFKMVDSSQLNLFHSFLGNHYGGSGKSHIYTHVSSGWRSSINYLAEWPHPTSTTDIPSASIPITIALDTLPSDPTDRPQIFDYDANQREEIRRLYWDRGACQPSAHIFPSRTIGGKVRRFVVTWFKEFRWLEYSVKVNKAFCLCCYLFRDNVEKHGGNDAFVVNGFNCWNKKESLYQHVGNVDSYHNRALQKRENLLKQHQSIVEAFNKKSGIEKTKYLIRLNATIDCVKLCMKTENPMRARDESASSLNRGMFLESLQFLRDHNEEIHAVS